ncbi:unnamed protein product [Polarella glacialis]|uniref:PWWP domain-containing protein n=1 Tax=Polarella glacialis TaxID=89957 RepID=A0A813I8R4_POLGL|nr:unnamed protein product [Polarella glacialis]
MLLEFVPVPPAVEGQTAECSAAAAAVSISAAALKEPAPAEQALERWLSVEGNLHLGLGLRLGAVYEEADLRRRCRGEKAKTERLERCLVDPSLLKEVTAPSALSAPSAAKRGSSARSSAASGLGAQKQRGSSAAAKDVLDPQEAERLLKRRKVRLSFVTGQVVWNTSTVPPRPAQISAIVPEREDPFLTRFLDQTPPEADFKIGDTVTVGTRPGVVIWDGRPSHSYAKLRWEDDAESCIIPLARIQTQDASVDAEIFVSGEVLQPLSVSDLLPKAAPRTPSEALSLPSSGVASSSLGDGRRRPGPRGAGVEGLAAGQVAWAWSKDHPPWPVRLLSSAQIDGPNKVWRVRPLGGSKGDEVVDEQVPASKLFSFAAGDAKALSRVSEEAEEACLSCNRDHVSVAMRCGTVLLVKNCSFCCCCQQTTTITITTKRAIL